MVYILVLSVAEAIRRWMSVKNTSQNFWEEAVLPWIEAKYFTRIFIQGLRESTKTSVDMVCLQTEVEPGNAGIHSESWIYPAAVLGAKTEAIGRDP
jgi:hypothetical protein